MSAHYEIERKYLVNMPELPLPCEAKASSIEQSYLKTEDGSSERVRLRDGVYYHTRKVRISGIRAEEKEDVVGASEAEALLKRRDPACATIRKTRYVFDYRGQIFELDVFPFWKKQAMLEIELAGEDTPVDWPDFLTLIREVTDDPRYKNHALAQSVPQEEV